MRLRTFSTGLALALIGLAVAGCGGDDSTSPVGVTGSIAVSSTPSGAAIGLDGHGTELVTPDTLEHVASGSHSLTLAKDGYQDTTVTATVQQDVITPVHVVLTSVAGPGIWSRMGRRRPRAPKDYQRRRDVDGSRATGHSRRLAAVLRC
jgi:hypothetical protein